MELLSSPIAQPQMPWCMGAVARVNTLRRVDRMVDSSRSVEAEELDAISIDGFAELPGRPMPGEDGVSDQTGGISVADDGQGLQIAAFESWLQVSHQRVVGLAIADKEVRRTTSICSRGIADQ